MAVLLAVRIGEAANPGPWPEDAICLKAGGWKTIGDGKGLGEPPRRGQHGSTTSPFDGPEIQETDDEDYTHPLEADGGLGNWSTAPPSEADLHSCYSDAEADDDGGCTPPAIGRDDGTGGSLAAHGGYDFYPSTMFNGAKAGYCFKLGHLGLGYYLDGELDVGLGIGRPKAYASQNAVVISLVDCIS